MKIRPVGAEFHAGGRADRHDETNSRFSQFCELALKLKFALLASLSAEIFETGVHRFTVNVITIPLVGEPEGCHEARSTLRTLKCQSQPYRT
jgi:hypothetical protein